MNVSKTIWLLWLLLPIVVGCGSLADSRSATSDCVPLDEAQLPADSQHRLGSGEEPQLARFEQPETLPTPVTEQRNEHVSLTLAALQQIALENHPALAAAGARMEAAVGKQVQAGLLPNPVIGYHATEIGNLGTAGQQGGFISQRFVTGGKLQLDQEIAGKEIDQAHFQIHTWEQRVLSDVRLRFYDVLVAQQRVKLTEQLARIGDDFVQATKTLLESRLGTENDLLQTEIRAEESQMLQDTARNQHAEAWRRLAAVVGVPAMQTTPLSGELDADIPVFDWDICYAMVLENNPKLMAAQSRVEQASIAFERAKKEWIPNLDVSVSVRHHNVTTSDVANVQVGIPIPIFDRNQGEIHRAQAEWIAATLEIQRLELDLQDRLAVVYRRYENARQQVERFRRRMLPRAKKSLELVTDGYQKGQVEYLTVLTAHQTYLNVNLAYLDSLQELRASAAEIEGRLLTGSLRN